jgi:hypothetical protein
MSDTMTATDSNGDKERTITLTARAVGPGDVWRSKEEVAQKERESRQFWADIPDTNRQAILVLVRDALLRLIEDLDEEVLRRRVETERMIAETTTDLVKLRGELTDEERARLEAEEGRS